MNHAKSLLILGVPCKTHDAQHNPLACGRELSMPCRLQEMEEASLATLSAACRQP